jgi:hypothetical protein
VKYPLDILSLIWRSTAVQSIADYAWEIIRRMRRKMVDLRVKWYILMIVFG